MSTGKIKINMDSLKTRREWTRHKVKDGHNVYRILPPFGESSNGYPYRKWQIIWGLQDPETGRSRPFASSMTGEKKCPVTEYVQSLKKKAEKLSSQMAASGVSEEDQKSRLTALNKLITDLNPKTVYVYNAADKSGSVGLLELKSTAQKKMKSEMTQYIQDYNQDPTSLNSEDTDSGVWFDITRSGLGRDTEYDVKKMQIKTKNPATGKISFEDDRSALPDAVTENYSNLAYDLSAVYQIKTYEELSDILEANMSLIVEMCPDADLGTTDVPVRKTTPTAVVAVTKATGVKPVTLKMDDEDDEEQQEVTPSRSRVAAAAAATTGTVKNNTRASTVLDDDDDFMAQADALLNS